MGEAVAPLHESRLTGAFVDSTDNPKSPDAGTNHNTRYTWHRRIHWYSQEFSLKRAPKEASGLLTITQLATETGISAARIRIWETRLGWPVPTRILGNRRFYAPSLLPDLREAARRSDCGRSMRQDIVDGIPVWLENQSRPRQQPYDMTRCAGVPEPRTDEGQRLRSDLMRGLASQDEAGVAATLAQIQTIHPDDRGPAILDVLRAVGHPLAATCQGLRTAKPTYMTKTTDASQQPVEVAIQPPTTEPVSTVPPVDSLPEPEATPVEITAEPVSPSSDSCQPCSPAPEVSPVTFPEAATPEQAAPPAQPVAAVTHKIAAVPPPKPRKPKNELSESDLADWTSRITAMQQERDQARRKAAERQAKKKEQAAAWRTLRRLVEEASRSQETEVDPVTEDALAQRVHLAPKMLRDVIDAVLTAHGH